MAHKLIPMLQVFDCPDGLSGIVSSYRDGPPESLYQITRSSVLAMEDTGSSNFPSFGSCLRGQRSSFPEDGYLW